MRGRESEFKGRAILVTGSTRGIGLAIAQRLIAQGAIVGIHGRDPTQVEQVCQSLSSAKGRAIPLAADFTEPSDAVALVRTFIDQAGGLDGLVNNAGGGKAKAFRALTLSDWRRTFAVNLEAPLLCSQEAYHYMRKQKRGAIVNIASLAAHGPGKWMGADYAASKAGVVSLTKSLALEAARFGIRVNAVSPGMIETDMTAPLTPEKRAGLGIPAQRLGEPDEVASVAAYLLSDRSQYTTGQVLHVNGGLG